MLDQLAKEYGIDANRINEMNKELISYKESLDKFDWKDCLDFISTTLPEKFTKKECTFFIFLYGITIGNKSIS